MTLGISVLVYIFMHYSVTNPSASQHNLLLRLESSNTDFWDEQMEVKYRREVDEKGDGGVQSVEWRDKDDQSWRDGSWHYEGGRVGGC